MKRSYIAMTTLGLLLSSQTIAQTYGNENQMGGMANPNPPTQNNQAMPSNNPPPPPPSAPGQSSVNNPPLAGDESEMGSENQQSQEPSKTIDGVDANGQQQRTIIDANGNLKIAPNGNTRVPVGKGPDGRPMGPQLKLEDDKSKGTASDANNQKPGDTTSPGNTQPLPQQAPPSQVPGGPRPGAGMPESSSQQPVNY